MFIYILLHNTSTRVHAEARRTIGRNIHQNRQEQTVRKRQKQEKAGARAGARAMDRRTEGGAAEECRTVGRRIKGWKRQEVRGTRCIDREKMVA